MKLIAFSVDGTTTMYYLWAKGKATGIAGHSIKVAFDYFNCRSYCTTYKHLVGRVAPDIVSVTTLPDNADFDYVKQNCPELLI